MVSESKLWRGGEGGGGSAQKAISLSHFQHQYVIYCITHVGYKLGRGQVFFFWGGGGFPFAPLTQPLAFIHGKNKLDRKLHVHPHYTYCLNHEKLNGLVVTTLYVCIMNQNNKVGIEHFE